VGSCVPGTSTSTDSTTVRYYSPGFSSSQSPPKGTESAPASCSSVSGKFTPG
jgi:hypothetical protein